MSEIVVAATQNIPHMQIREQTANIRSLQSIDDVWICMNFFLQCHSIGEPLTDEILVHGDS